MLLDGIWLDRHFRFLTHLQIHPQKEKEEEQRQRQGTETFGAVFRK